MIQEEFDKAQKECWDAHRNILEDDTYIDGIPKAVCKKCWIRHDITEEHHRILHSKSLSSYEIGRNA